MLKSSALIQVSFGLILLLSLVCWAPLAFGQSTLTEGVLRNADRMVYDMEKKTVRLEGNVQVVFQGQHVSCDRAEINQATETLIAEGNVILTSDRIHVESQRIEFNYKKNTGFIYNGFVQSGQVIFEGEVIEKVSENRFLATNAAYTACETCPPGWSFSGSKIDAELGGYARIRRPLFRIGGVPVLFLPGIIVPLKSSRQSGFLVPSMAFSQKGGVALSGIYFWAIDRSQDLTLTAKWYSLRGYKLLQDYRYVLSEESQGRLSSAWMEDKALQEEYRLQSNVDRWFVSYDHIYELPHDYVHRANFNLVSDLRYTRDFPEEILGHGDPALENKTSISKSVDNQYMSLEADMYTNLLHYDPLARNEDAVHRAPTIRYSIKEQEIANTGFFGSMNFNYMNFARNTFRHDDFEPCVDSAGEVCTSRLSPLGAPVVGSPLDGGSPQHDGSFDRRYDLNRTGQRTDIQPRISYPFHIGDQIDLLPSVLFRETQYRFDPPCASDGVGCEPAFSETAARRYVQTEVWAKTEFSRVFEANPGDVKANRWKHVVEPAIGYSQIPWMRRPNHEFFGDNIGLQSNRQFEPISDTDLGNPTTGVQFDYEDRTYEKRVLNYSLHNRLTRKSWANGSADYKTLALFELNQSYDFNEATRPRNAHPWSAIDAKANIRLENFETYTTASFNPYARRTNTASRVKLMYTRQDYVQAFYTQNFQLNEDDFTPIPNREVRNIGLGAGFITKYLEFDGRVNFSDITKQVHSWQYGVRIRPPGNCWLIQIQQTQVLGGDPTIRGSLNFNFGGETSPMRI